jgi:hypothetical protein
VIFLAIPSIILLILSLYTFHIGDKELDYTCQTGEKIDGWNVLDGTADCWNGDDEDDNATNQEFRDWVDEQNNTAQPYENRASLMILGSVTLGVIFYFYIVEFSWRVSEYFDDGRRFDFDLPQSASGANFSPEMAQARAEFPHWNQYQIQAFFDQGWSNAMLHKWIESQDETLQKKNSINEKKREVEKRFNCSYCNSRTNEVCDVPNGCKNGICKKCRESGRAKRHYRYVVAKKGWISNQVYPVQNGYKCYECSKSKWRDDGSDVGY